MKIESRIVKRYRFREGYVFLLMEDDAAGAVLYYLRANNRDEQLFIKRVEGSTLDDTEAHLREIELIGDSAVLRYEAIFQTGPLMSASSVSRPAAAPISHGAAAPAAETPAQKPVIAESIQKPAAAPAEEKKEEKPKPAPKPVFRSPEEEEKARRKSLALLQRNSMIDYRYNRQGQLVKQLQEGSQTALVSDIFSVIELVNRRIHNDIRPDLLSMLPYYRNNDFETEYALARDKESTVRYVVNESGLMTACQIAGGKYPLCQTILMIFRQLAEQSEEGMDAFHEYIINRMNEDMAKGH